MVVQAKLLLRKMLLWFSVTHHKMMSLTAVLAYPWPEMSDTVNPALRAVQLFFTPLSQALRLIIHLGEPLPSDKLDMFSTDTRALLLFFTLPYVLMMWTNGVGASTGMFVPALAVGATGETRLSRISTRTYT